MVNFVTGSASLGLLTSGSWDALRDRVVVWLPNLLLVMVVLVTGLIAAALVRRAVIWLVDKSGLEALMERLGVARLLYTVGSRKGAAHAFGQMVYVAVLLLISAIIAEILGLPGVAEGVAIIVAFVPRFVGAVAIMLAGLFIADMLRSIVRQMTRGDDAELEAPDVVAQAVYYLVVTIAVTMSVEQIGLETGLVNSLIQIGLGAAALSCGLAFAFGSRDVFKSLLARFYMERLVRPGDEIVLEDGRPALVVGFSPTSVVAQIEQETILLPCRVLVDGAVTIRRLPRQKSE